MSKIIVCPDSFKGCLSAFEAADIITKSLFRLFSDVRIISLPLADGGEGTGRVLSSHGIGEISKIDSCDALGKPLKADILISKEKEECLIEAAETVGIMRIPRDKLNVMETSSYGLGLAVKEAVKTGSSVITVTLGGSAVCDAGMGMLQALGYRFYDKYGNALYGKSKDMLKVSYIDDRHVIKEIKKIQFNVICDVDNPLYGEGGASFVYSPQKGASPEEVILLDRGLRNFASCAIQSGIATCEAPFFKGAGASGGLGYALMAFLKAGYVRGIDYILDLTDFDDEIKDADLIITGEGKIDRQSLMGKVLSGILDRASKYKIPVLAYGGTVADSYLLKHEFLMGCYSISDLKLSLEDNMKKTQTLKNIERTIIETSSVIKSFLSK